MTLMKNNPISLDVETTGLSADDEIISIALYEPGDHPPDDDIISQGSNTSEKELLQALSISVQAMSTDTVLVTFNGQNFKYGFDFPLLRTRFHKHGIAWPFGGMMHVDIYPLIEKRWSTVQPYWQTLDQLLVDDLKVMVRFFGIDGKLKVKQNYIDLINDTVRAEDISKYIHEHFESKIRDINTLKGAYQIITGKDPGEMDGKESIKLWQQYQKIGGSDILEQIRQYNLDDCKKTMELYEICLRYCSQRDMTAEVL